MSCHGSLLQYDLDPHHCTGIPKEKICDDTSIELSVSAKAQWPLQRKPNSRDLQLPLSESMLAHIYQERLKYRPGKPDHTDDRWLSQVEIVTHAGPHRRLWMGPQFQFQTYQNGTQGAPQNILDTPSTPKSTTTASHPSPLTKLPHTKPVNMPLIRSSAPYPILIEAGSVSSCEPSPKLFEHLQALDQHQQQQQQQGGVGGGETRLKEDLADAMMEQQQQQKEQQGVGGEGGTGGVVKDAGGRCVIVSINNNNNKTTINKHIQPSQTVVAKIVNPLGKVLTVTAEDHIIPTDMETNTILENCDESLFRPVVRSKAVVYSDPICLQTKNSATNTIHLSTNKPKQKKNGKKIVEGKEKTPPLPIQDKQTSAKVKKQKQDASVLVDVKAPPEPSIVEALQQSLNQEDVVSSTVLSLSVDDAMQEAATESAEQTDLCDFSDVVCDFPEQFVADSPVIPDDLDTYAYSPSPSKTEEASQKKKPIKYDRYQGLEAKDIVVSSSEENVECERTLSKKPRKPKAKLGVRINKDAMSDSRKSEEFNSPKVVDRLEFEVIPPPKFAWSSAKPADLNLPNDHDWTIGAFSTFDAWNEFPEIAQTAEKEPAKSWSSILKSQSSKAAKTDLLGIQFVEDESTSNLLIQVDSDVEIDVKKVSSDEDKPNSEPSAEDDDSPANAMDTEEDGQKVSLPAVGKVNKRKSKKKKK